MSKVKIWDKEVNSCSKCKYFYEDDDCNVACPYKDSINLNSNNNYENIHKDCPFLKPITKEVIESFGFEYLDCKSILLMFRKRLTDGNVYNLWLGNKFNNYTTTIFKDPSEQLIFKGVINNPEELRFILTSLGICSTHT